MEKRRENAVDIDAVIFKTSLLEGASLGVSVPAHLATETLTSFVLDYLTFIQKVVLEDSILICIVKGRHITDLNLLIFKFFNFHTTHYTHRCYFASFIS